MNRQRRAMICDLMAISALAAVLPAGAATAPQARIPQRVRARIIVDNDLGGDPDGLVALAHQLLSPTTRVTLVTASALNPKFATPERAGRGAAIGAGLARELLRLIPASPSVSVVAGPEGFVTEGGASAAARAIVAEATREDALPLIFTCGGPLTNLAAALRLEPRIAQRMSVIWIGGAAYPEGGWEYNLMTDLDSAREVIGRSTIPLWQVPQDAYRQMQYSIARLDALLHRGSALARWLYGSFTNPPSWADIGGTWPLGDSPLVLLSALSSESCLYVEQTARALQDDGRYGQELAARRIRVYRNLDARLTFDDMEALLGAAARTAAP